MGKKSRGFSLTAPLTQPTFEKCWDSLSMRQKEKVREKADEWNITNRDVLNRWPALRVEAK